jgi:acyl-CoA reductase-like NAD-dependent aldehyde dehydrogenase
MAVALAEYGLAVAGVERPSLSGSVFESIDPTQGAPWAEISQADQLDVEDAVTAAAGALDGAWGRLSPTRRGRILMRWADLIDADADRIAAVETRDNGKLLRETKAQLRVVPDWLYYFGGLADKVEGRVIPLERENVLNYTLREPVGVTAIIAPWNSPVLLATMAAAPALAAGNAIVIKPSELASASVLEVARVAAEAGFPDGTINVVCGGPTVGAALVANERVAKISFTGGSAAAKRVAAQAGARFARLTLELGGKSPNLVFADADLKQAEAGIVAGIYAASGQTCIAGSRALVQAPVFEELTDALAARAGHIRLGDPADPETQMGPLISQAHLERTSAFVSDAERGGGEVIAGGSPAHVDGRPSGYFFSPTIIRPASTADSIVQEEVFGPVLTIMPFESEEEAIELANASRFGLAAGVWTKDLARAHRIARRLRAGTVWINMYRALSFNSPFGGFKESGLGRTNGFEAIYEYLETKSVWCNLDEGVDDPFVLRV